ncbi:MAG: hypothetical protein NZ700_02645 [Gemmataceae bacterium]|nr:hypothetical protein [Gemmataceae bacterium]MDW8264135.1 hypothetical protein [Gemmataceae bacterium]
MNVVSRFEATLLEMLGSILARRDCYPLERWPLRTTAVPRQLSRSAVDLIRDRLAKGCVLALARAGGWQRDSFLRGTEPVHGRLWERTPPTALALQFTSRSLAFLLWVVGGCHGDDARIFACPPSAGDGVLIYLTYGALRVVPAIAQRLPKFPVFRHNALCRLAWPEDFVGAPLPDFVPWARDSRSLVLEALQEELARRWVAIERAKSDIGDWRQLQRLGDSQDELLREFHRALDAAGRWDLARFLLRAAHQLIRGGVTADDWVRCLSQDAPPSLAERLAVRWAAAAFWRHLGRLEEWQRAARLVGYLDEGYAASQLWKTLWEQYQGDSIASCARRVVHELCPLRPSPQGG